ncbi:MAG TPA: tetratricopeptide repeat protein, partial [Gemmatimonadales bacterium]
QYDRAIERYRTVLANTPRDVIALNNLAYSLAVHKNQPAEALVYAERAYTLGPTAPVADTLGWVQHLLGRDQEAARLLAAAVKRDPNAAELRLHAAVVYAALGLVESAGRELKEAVRLDPAMEKRAEAASVREKVKK